MRSGLGEFLDDNDLIYVIQLSSLKATTVPYTMIDLDDRSAPVGTLARKSE